MILENCKVIACVGTSQPEKAKAFYSETLGLKLLEDAWWAIVFDAGDGTRLNIEKAEERFTPLPFVVLGWKVTEIESRMRQLAEKGVRFERPLGLQLDPQGVWKPPSGVAKVCWFKDPDGNLLSLSQFP